MDHRWSSNPAFWPVQYLGSVDSSVGRVSDHSVFSSHAPLPSPRMSRICGLTGELIGCCSLIPCPLDWGLRRFKPRADHVTTLCTFPVRPQYNIFHDGCAQGTWGRHSTTNTFQAVNTDTGTYLYSLPSDYQFLATSHYCLLTSTSTQFLPSSHYCLLTPTPRPRA